MNGNNKQNSTTILDLVLNFEDLIEKGRIGTYNKDEFLQLINFYQSKNDYDKALEIADYAIYQYKHIVTFYLVKSNLLLNTHKPNTAMKYIEHCENISPYDYEIKIAKAKAYSMQGNIDEAWEILKEMEAISNLNYVVEINIVKSYIYEFNSEYENMFYILKDALVIDPQNTEALHRINLATIFSRKYQESVVFHQKLVDDAPYNYLAWYNLGQISSGLLNYNEALDYYEYSFLINPEFEDGYLDYTELCIQVGDYKNAIIVYEEYLEKFEADVDIFINIIDSYLKLGDIKKAKEYAFKTIKMDPYNDEAYFLLGKIYSIDEKWSKALNAFHKAIEMDCEREEYYEALAKMYIKLGDYHKAETYYDILLGMDTVEVNYYIDYINFLIKQSKYDKAYDIINYSEEIVYSPLFNFFKSVINFKKNNKKEALYQLDSALAEDYEDYKIIFDIAPELQYDKDINSMINYYRN